MNEKSVFVRHQECGECGSSDALAVYRQPDGSHDGYCFSCGFYEANPLNETRVESVVEEKEVVNLDSIKELNTFQDDLRMLTKDSLEYFGVKHEVSTTDGKTITAHYYPYTKSGTISGYKKRVIPKLISSIGDTKDVELFGQKQATSAGRKKLFITEGELDCVSVYQSLKQRSRGTEWEHFSPAVVSICHGSNAAVRDISRNIDFVKQFEQIILVFDQDEPGKKAIQEVLKLIPDAFVAQLSEKDASDMLIKGKSAELSKSVLFGATRQKPSSVVGVEDVYERAIRRPVMGQPWPWPSLTKLTYGRHTKTLYGLGAGVGIGKSDWTKQLQAHIITNDKRPVGICALEEDVGRTLKGIAGKIHKKMFHKPDGNYTQDQLVEAIDQLKGKVFMYDHMGTKGWDDIKSAIRYMVVVEGIKDIFIDPLTALHAHLRATEANDMLGQIMSQLSGMVHELDFTCYYLCHLNTPDSGPDHERGGKVHESQFTGSRSMMRWSQYLMGLERNKDPDLPEDERNTSRIVLLKDREFGNVGTVTVFYNRETGSFLEPDASEY